MGLNISLMLINFELDQMSNYLNLVGAAIEQRLEDVEAYYQKESERNMSGIEVSLFLDQWTDDYLEVGRGFPQLLLTSFIIAWYAFAEQELLKLCENLELQITVKPQDNINFGTGIWRARKFLLETIDYKINERHWHELARIGKLRNVLVHEGRSISWSHVNPTKKFVAANIDDKNVYIKINKDLYQYLTNHEIIEHTNYKSEISPSFTYCEHLISFGKNLFSTLYSDLYPK